MPKDSTYKEMQTTYNTLMTTARKWFKDVTDEELQVIILGAMRKAVEDIHGKQ